MNFAQEFCLWWYTHVFNPFGQFIYVENLVWTTIIVAVVTTVLLGVFYKPGDPWQYGVFMERYGFPLAILAVASLCLPTFSVILMLVMPVLLMLGAGAGLLLLMFLCIQKLREEYQEHLCNELHRLEQERRASRNPGDYE